MRSNVTRILVGIVLLIGLAFVMGRTSKGCCRPDDDEMCAVCGPQNLNAYVCPQEPNGFICSANISLATVACGEVPVDEAVCRGHAAGDGTGGNATRGAGATTNSGADDTATEARRDTATHDATTASIGSSGAP